MAMNRFGQGAAIYIGTYLTDGNAEAIFDVVLKHVKTAPLAKAAPGVEISCRSAKDRRLFFVLNHHAKSQRVTGLPGGTELISGKKCGGNLSVKPFDVAVVEVKKQRLL
jgi:beta-galactosidase